MSIFMRVIPSAILLLCFVQDAIAKDVQISTEKTQGFYRHILTNCPFQKGVVAYTYNNRHPEISDLCFDKKRGTFLSSEVLTKLELAVEGNQSKTYENLSGARGRRPYVKVYTMSDMNDYCAVSMDNPTFIEVGNFRSRRKKGAFVVGLEGYFYDTLSTIPGKKTFNKTGLTIHLTKNTGPQDSQFYGEALSGILNVKANQGAIKLTAGTGHDSRNQYGVITIKVHPDGTVTGEGNYHIENSRIKGHARNEWKVADARFIDLKGHVIGPNAQNIKLRGWAKGTYVDVRNRKYSFEGLVVFEACRSTGKPKRKKRLPPGTFEVPMNH